MKTMLAVIAALVLMLLMVFTFMDRPVQTQTAEAPQLTGQQLCIAAGEGAKRPGYDLISARCLPNGDMCFKYMRAYPEKFEYYFVASNGHSIDGFLDDDFSVNENGKIIGAPANTSWNKGMPCYEGKQGTKPPRTAS